MSTSNWTVQEQNVARQAFEVGKQRSITVLIKSIQHQTQRLETPDSIWELHDFLSTKRFQYEGRSNFDLNNILFTLADMIKQDLINYDDLAGFDQKKMGKIKAMSMF